MIVPDTNLLLYAHFERFPEHGRARAWWEALLSGDDDVGLALPVVFAFVRLASSRQLFDPPRSVEEVLLAVESWLGRPQVRVLPAGARSAEIAFRLLRESGGPGQLGTDAQIAAAAIEHGGELHSNDGDFARFPGLRWRNPLRERGGG